MANDYFQDDGNPGYRGAFSSSPIRTLFAAIETGFDKLCGLTGNGGKIVAINAGGTAQEALSTTGTGNVVRATSPTLVTPALGTPVSGTLTNCTGLVPATGLSAVTGTGSAVLATSPTLVTPAIGTPSSGTLTNCTGLVPATGLSSVTGTGAAVLANSPTLVTPALGTPTALVGTNITGTAAALNIGGNAATATTATTATNAGTSGTFTITGTGFVSDPTTTATWKVNNGIATLYIPYSAIDGTSDNTGFTLTGLPADIRSTSNQYTGLIFATDNGAAVNAVGFLSGGGSTITLFVTTGTGVWVAAGTKGLLSTIIQWPLN